MTIRDLGDKIGGCDIAQVDSWIDLPLTCNYYTVLYLVGDNHLFDWESVDIKWWSWELWI